MIMTSLQMPDMKLTSVCIEVAILASILLSHTAGTIWIIMNRLKEHMNMHMITFFTGTSKSSKLIQ